MIVQKPIWSMAQAPIKSFTFTFSSFNEVIYAMSNQSTGKGTVIAVSGTELKAQVPELSQTMWEHMKDAFAIQL